MLTVVQYALDKGWNKPFKLKCYTYCELMLHTRKERFRATTSYLCGKWFDWCLFNHGTEREGEYESYSGKILGFIKVETPGFPADPNKCYIAIMRSSSPLAMEDLEENFLKKFQVRVGDVDDFCVVPLESIIHPFCVLHNYGGNKIEYWGILPKRKWGQYFERFINSKSFL